MEMLSDLAMSPEAEGLLTGMPTEVSTTRKKVVQQALSLKGKVHYFWGGKSRVIGWDEAGNIQIIHCASGNLNNVVVTGKSGFTSVGRPYYYGE